MGPGSSTGGSPTSGAGRSSTWSPGSAPRRRAGGRPRAAVTATLTALLAERGRGAVVGRRLVTGDDRPRRIAGSPTGCRSCRSGSQDWRPSRPIDVCVSNAALQWVPRHASCCRAGRRRCRRRAGWRSRCRATSTRRRTRCCARWARRRGGPPARPAGRWPVDVRPPSEYVDATADVGWASTSGRRRTCTCCRARPGAGVGARHRPAAGARALSAARPPSSRRMRRAAARGLPAARRTAPSPVPAHLLRRTGQ